MEGAHCRMMTAKPGQEALKEALDRERETGNNDAG